jgi:hypothetical protein
MIGCFCSDLTRVDRLGMPVDIKHAIHIPIYHGVYTLFDRYSKFLSPFCHVLVANGSVDLTQSMANLSQDLQDC